MNYNKLYLSIVPLLIVLSISWIQGNSSDEGNISSNIELTSVLETEIVSEGEVNFIDESISYEVPSCSSLSGACPCGGKCEADPGNVCTLCSEWETQKKFVKCVVESE